MSRGKYVIDSMNVVRQQIDVHIKAAVLLQTVSVVGPPLSAKYGRNMGFTASTFCTGN
jgi:hypothetical protein